MLVEKTISRSLKQLKREQGGREGEETDATKYARASLPRLVLQDCMQQPWACGPVNLETIGSNLNLISDVVFHHKRHLSINGLMTMIHHHHFVMHNSVIITCYLQLCCNEQTAWRMLSQRQISCRI